MVYVSAGIFFSRHVRRVCVRWSNIVLVYSGQQSLLEFQSGSFRGTSYTGIIDSIVNKYANEYVLVPDLDSIKQIKTSDFSDEEELGKFLLFIKYLARYDTEKECYLDEQQVQELLAMNPGAYTTEEVDGETLIKNIHAPAPSDQEFEEFQRMYLLPRDISTWPTSNPFEEIKNMALGTKVSFLEY